MAVGCPYTTLAGAVKRTLLGVYEIGSDWSTEEPSPDM